MLSQFSSALKGIGNAVKQSVNSVSNSFSKPENGNKPTLGRVVIGSRELEEINLISQGGYAYIFKVRDVSSGQIFALKQMICQNEARLKTARNEVNVLRKLPEHENLLKVYDYSSVQTDNGTYVYVLLELCEGGSVFDLMAKYESTKLAEKQIIFIMREICEGVKVLHSQKPPIAHRDLKIENVLLHNKKFKICDFGSCSSKFVDFAKIPKEDYRIYEDEYDKNTTLMYRPPEMCDPYKLWAVTEKVDVWMIGCILFTLCFYKHPFMEMTKLSIINAAFTFPKDHNYPEKLLDICRLMLTPDPKFRPTIFDISDIFANYFNIDSIKLNPEAQKLKDDAIIKDKEIQAIKTKGKKNYDGDIPLEDLMKLQTKILKGQKKSDGLKDWQGGMVQEEDFNDGFDTKQQIINRGFDTHKRVQSTMEFGGIDNFGQKKNFSDSPVKTREPITLDEKFNSNDNPNKFKKQPTKNASLGGFENFEFKSKTQVSNNNNGFSENWDNFGNSGLQKQGSNNFNKDPFQNFSFGEKNSNTTKKDSELIDPFEAFSFGGQTTQPQNIQPKIIPQSLPTQENNMNLAPTKQKSFESFDLLGIEEQPQPKKVDLTELNDIKFI